MNSTFTESTPEEATFAWLETIGRRIAHCPVIGPDTPAAEPDLSAIERPEYWRWRR
jgi:hypothetical protein